MSVRDYLVAQETKPCLSPVRSKAAFSIPCCSCTKLSSPLLVRCAPQAARQEELARVLAESMRDGNDNASSGGASEAPSSQGCTAGGGAGGEHVSTLIFSIQQHVRTSIECCPPDNARTHAHTRFVLVVFDLDGYILACAFLVELARTPPSQENIRHVGWVAHQSLIPASTPR